MRTNHAWRGGLLVVFLLLLASCSRTPYVVTTAHTRVGLLDSLRHVQPVGEQVELASRYLELGKYRKAGRALDSIATHHPTGEVFYHRAVCHIKERHYALAIGDLERAYGAPRASTWVRQQCEQLIPELEHELRRRYARRQNFWSGVLHNTLQFFLLVLHLRIEDSIEERASRRDWYEVQSLGSRRPVISTSSSSGSSGWARPERTRGNGFDDDKDRR